MIIEFSNHDRNPVYTVIITAPIDGAQRRDTVRESDFPKKANVRVVIQNE